MTSSFDPTTQGYLFVDGQAHLLPPADEFYEKFPQFEPAPYDGPPNTEPPEAMRHVDSDAR